MKFLKIIYIKPRLKLLSYKPNSRKYRYFYFYRTSQMCNAVFVNTSNFTYRYFYKWVRHFWNTNQLILTRCPSVALPNNIKSTKLNFYETLYLKFEYERSRSCKLSYQINPPEVAVEFITEKCTDNIC